MRRKRLFLDDKTLLKIINGKRCFCQPVDGLYPYELKPDSVIQSNNRVMIFQSNKDSLTIDISRFGIGQTVMLPMSYEFIERHIDPKYSQYNDLAGYKNKAKAWVELMPYMAEVVDVRIGRLRSFEEESNCMAEDWKRDPYVFCYTIMLTENKKRWQKQSSISQV